MAIFNNGYPATYPQIYQPQIQYAPQMPLQGTQMSQANQQQSGIIWVQGEAGAKSYLIAPNNTVQLWDSESQTIYLKSADASGMPSMKILDYKIRDGSTQAPDTQENIYATKSDLEALQQKIASLRSEIDDLTTRRHTRLTREAPDE